MDGSPAYRPQDAPPAATLAAAETARPAPLLRLEGIGYGAGATRILDIPHLEIAAGGPTAIMGPNGAGKSMLLRLLHGLIAPQIGQILWSDPALCAAQAMVFQRPVLLRRSVAANIDYALKAKGMARRARAPVVAEMLAKGGLGALTNRPARSLSGGEQQRLAVIRALATRPRILFMDEATANLDPAATEAIETLARTASAEGTKVIFVSHDPGQARRLATEVVFLSQGRLVEQSPAARFFERPGSAAARAYLAGELFL